jgi:hypothetical protein
MARNNVEYHIQAGAFHTFKVAAGQTIRIGQIVELTGDLTVGVAGADSDSVVGVVYSGTVGIDGLTDGYKGDNGDVVTVVVLKPFVYLTADGAITAGAILTAGANGRAVAGATPTVGTRVGIAVTGAATAGEKFVAMLG